MQNSLRQKGDSNRRKLGVFLTYEGSDVGYVIVYATPIVLSTLFYRSPLNLMLDASTHFHLSITKSIRHQVGPAHFTPLRSHGLCRHRPPQHRLDRLSGNFTGTPDTRRYGHHIEHRRHL